MYGMSFVAQQGKPQLSPWRSGTTFSRPAEFDIDFSKPFNIPPFAVDKKLLDAGPQVFLSDLQEYDVHVEVPGWHFGKNGEEGSPGKTPIKMHATAARAMATSMFLGGSWPGLPECRPESLPKNM